MQQHLPRVKQREHSDLEHTRIDMSAPSVARGKLQRDRAYLVVLAGSNVGEMYRLDQAEVVIGRAVGATIQLLDDGISRRHARVLRSGHQVFVEDLRSSNGTMVNGEPVTRVELRDGDKIRLGANTILKFTYHDQLDESFQQRMYDAALRDGLTRAYNKKFFLDRMDTELAFARRHSSPLSLVMFDVDHFKKVNDTYGHPTGDVVLQAVAALAAKTVRTEDVFARYGGEEFAVICRGVALGNGGILGERIRSGVEQLQIATPTGSIQVTVSVGVAAFPETQASSPADLVAAADEALYHAKRTGRNRVLLKHA
jgi:two-component system cell cycle response regulator